MTMINVSDLTIDSLTTFLVYANDAGNWGDMPWVSNGNIKCTKQMRGNLSDLVKKGLIQLGDNGDGTCITFTTAGSELAARCGIEVQALAE
jgi:hypothetical protein